MASDVGTVSHVGAVSHVGIVSHVGAVSHLGTISAVGIVSMCSPPIAMGPKQKNVSNISNNWFPYTN